MRFFTPAWHGGEMPEALAERIAERYEAHLSALGPRLPNDARRLWTEVSLHDGLLRSVERAANRFEMVFRAGDDSSGHFDARLSYGDVDLSRSDEQFLRNSVGRREVELLYDEFDSTDTGWTHSFLFWPYREVSVHFGAFTLAVTPALGRFDSNEAGGGKLTTGDESTH